MKMKSTLAILVMTMSISLSVSAQTKGSAESKVSTTGSTTDLAQARSSLIAATNDFKKTSEALARLQEDELKKATDNVAQLRQLFTDGLIARNELEQSEQSLAALKSRLETTKQQAVQSDQIIAEVRASEELAKKEALAARTSSKTFVRPVIMRYGGSTQWTVANLGNIQGFFLATFGRSLPISTIGQSATHNRLGWDHRHAADVGLHPDSKEGQALISYLQSQGIPFLAFRSAVPGVSTGPHIHIGTPSHRLS